MLEPERHDSRAIDVSFAVPQTHRLRFTEDVFGADDRALVELLESSGAAPPRVQFWIDQNVLEARPELRQRIVAFGSKYADRITRVGGIQIVPGGEEIKNDIHILERMLKVMNVADLDRRSYVVVIGGGAVLDAVGFAASIAHRGLRLVRLPTTTLAQADSGVGVKSGVNLFQKKNWVGSFATPWAVVNDRAMLETLGDRDYRCGFSEAVKVALLKDATLFDAICRATDSINQRDPAIASAIIRKSALLHLDHITRGGDPFEALEARPLDFGHWSAHKLEAMTDFSLRHGEAVAIGVAIDVVYSSLKLGLPEADARRTLDCLRRLGFTLDHPALDDGDVLIDGMEEFRQHLGGRLTLTMLEGVGQPIDVHEFDRDAMRLAIERARSESSERRRSPGSTPPSVS